MRILLIGEFSGVHQNLAIGLRLLGHEVLIASNQDGGKGYDCDLLIPNPRKKRFKAFYQVAQIARKFDVIQLMVDGVLGERFGAYLPFIFLLRKNSKKLFMCSAGCDYRFHTQGKKELQIPLFEELQKAGETTYDNFSSKIRNNIFCKLVDGIIPLQLEYYAAYKDHPKCTKPILFPFDASCIEHSTEAVKKTPLNFYHGASKKRSGFKGSSHIEAAFKKASKIYPETQAKFLINDLVPFEEYKKIIQDTGVLFDQTNGKTYGMNVLLGWAQGKIVGVSLNINDPQWQEWIKLVGINPNDVPFVPTLSPNSENILKAIDQTLALSQEELILNSEKARAFVEKYHDPKKIAEQFISTWTT